MTPFCKSYLAAQGVIILPPRRIISVSVEKKEKEVMIPRVNEYERVVLL